MPKPKAKTTVDTKITISPPNFEVFETTLRGTAPLVMNNFMKKVIDAIKEKQEGGEPANTARGRQRPPKDFHACFIGSQHFAEAGWSGINAIAFRAAMVRACSNLGVEMVKAKMNLFVLPDGFEKGRGTPLVKITKGKPEAFDAPVRNATGVMDLRTRARWAPGWECKIRVRYNAAIFQASTIANLIQHAGISVGVCGGRPCSTNSVGQGWGTFEIKGT